MNNSFDASKTARLCDHITLRTFTTVQPHGVIFIVRCDDLTILQVSENVEPLLGFTSSTLLKTSFSSLLSVKHLAQLHARLLHATYSLAPLTLRLQQDATAIDCWLHLHKDEHYYIFECEPCFETESIEATTLSAMLMNPDLNLTTVQTLENSVTELSPLIAHAFKHFTQYDEVMVYQFDEQWCGTVIAEEKPVEMPAYLGLKFPATDVPKPIRDFYLIGRYRYIPDVNYQSAMMVPILSADMAYPADFTYCTLRAVAPVHVEYLQNMQAAASVSFALVVQGRLWGLIACHHRTPHYLSSEARLSLCLLADWFAVHIALLETKQAMQRQTTVMALQNDLITCLAETKKRNRDAALAQYLAAIMQVVNANGIILYSKNQQHACGQTPAPTQIVHLLHWLNQQVLEIETIFITDNLSTLYEASKAYASIACGLLAIKIAPQADAYILFFRSALNYTVHWAGNPAEPFDLNTETSLYHPRQSFKTWKESVQNHALPWQDEEIQLAIQLKIVSQAV